LRLVWKKNSETTPLSPWALDPTPYPLKKKTIPSTGVWLFSGTTQPKKLAAVL